MATSQIPDRTRSDDYEDAIPDEDTSETSNLFLERLRAWKHACGYLEDYIGATEKYEATQAKEYEKVVKTVSNPLREGEHFDQNLGGISEMFDHIRQNTQSISNVHADTAKQLKGTVIPIFERLHQEIKNKTKEMQKGVGKSAKTVDKARNTTQKHIESLATASATGTHASGGKVDPMNDPYIIQKGVYHRLHKQVGEENNARGDMLSVQNSFSQFEAHIVQTFQQGMGQFMQAVGTQAEQQRHLYSVMVEKAQQVNPVFEWNGFVQRNSNVLVDPNQPQRKVENIAFANKDHASTQAMIQGSLERKAGTIMKKWESGFYVVTPSKFLHEFKTEDNVQKDPSPELSLYLPDCTIGGCNGKNFAIKGKDVSKTGLAKAVGGSKEYEFAAHTDSDAEQWYRVIKQAGSASGATTESAPSSQVNSPTSPSSRNVSGAQAFPPTSAEQAAPSAATTGYGQQTSQTASHVPESTNAGGYGNAPTGGANTGSSAGSGYGGLGSATHPSAAGGTGVSDYAQQGSGAAGSHVPGSSGISGQPGQY